MAAYNQTDPPGGSTGQGAESDVYGCLVFLAAHHLSVCSAATRTIVTCEYACNGVAKIFNISKIATNIKSLFTVDPWILTLVLHNTERIICVTYVMFHFSLRHRIASRAE